MNWFNILKNQIASTKGKTFQLDFNEPMVEDTNCKDKLRELANRVKEISSIDGYEQTRKRQNDSYGHASTFRLIDDERYSVQIRSKDKLNEVPEEVCCALIDMYKSTANNDYKMSGLIPPNKRRHLQGFKLYVEKSSDNLNDGEDVSTHLSIQKRGGNEFWPVYLIDITVRVGAWELLDRPNHNRKICEKLTKEYVKL